MRGTLLAMLIGFVGNLCLAQPPAKKPSSASTQQPVRAHGDPLPAGAIRRLVTIAYHNGSYHSTAHLAFFDARTIQTVGRYHIGTCDVESGTYTWQYVSPGRPVGYRSDDLGPGLSLAADGRTAAFAGDDPLIVIYDTRNADKLHEFRLKHMAYLVALASDGSLLAYREVAQPAPRRRQDASDEKSDELPVIVLDVASGKELLRVKAERASVTRLAFSPDKRTLLVCDDSTIRVWDIGARKESTKAQVPAGFSIFDAAVSPDGRILAAGASNAGAPNQDGLVVAWNIATGKELWRGDEPAYAVIAVAFSPDGKRLASGADRKSPEGGVLRIRDVASGKSSVCIENKSVSFALELAFDQSGKFVASTGADQTIHIWDAGSGVELHPRQGHQGKVNNVAFYACGRLLLSVSEAGGTARVWDVANGRQVHVFRAREGALTEGAISRDGKIAATCGDGFVILWDMATGKQLRKLSLPPPKPGLARYLGGIDFSVDGTVLRATSVDAPRQDRFAPPTRNQQGAHSGPVAWEVNTGKPITQGTGGDYVAVMGSSDGKTTVSSTGIVFDTASGTELFRLYEEGPLWMTYGGDGLRFSDDGRMLAGAATLHSGRSVDRVWEVMTGGVVRTLKGNSHGRFLAFSPDARVLAGYDSPDIVLSDTVSDKLIRRFEDSRCSALAFAPDGKALASGQDDGTILLWPIDPGRWQHADADPRTPKELESKWADLTSSDAHVGQLAVRSLVESPAEAIPFLKERMKPGEAVDSAKIRQLISDMGSANFAVRDKAFQQLRKVGGCAEPALREFLAKKPPAEEAERVRSLLRDLLRVHSPDEVRCLRGIQVLETIGSAEARAILQTVAARATTPRERDDAAASLERLSERALFPPAPAHVRAEDIKAARRIIDKALQAHGGAATLARLKAVTGEAKGKSYETRGESMEFSMEFALQPPEREWCCSRTKQENGQEFRIVTARDGDRAWSKVGKSKGNFTAESREQMREDGYAAWIKMLYPLADRTIPVASLGKSQVEGRPVAGVVVTAKGHRPIKLFFDEETGLLAKVEIRGEDSRGIEATYEQIHGDYGTFVGVKCATRLRTFKDGKLSDEIHIIRMKRTEKLDDKLFVEPP